MTIVAGTRVSEIVAAPDVAVPADLGINDYLMVLDAGDVSGGHAAASGNYKPMKTDWFAIKDANKNLLIDSGTYTSSGANTADLVGGHGGGTLFHVDHTYTADQDPLPYGSGGQLGVGFLYDGTVNLNYDDGNALIGNKQATAYFGPRAAFSMELTQIISQNQGSYGHGPVAFMDTMMTKNVAGATRQFCAGYSNISAKMAAADGGAVTLKRTDANDGTTAFFDNTTFVTAGSGTITATDGSDYSQNSFVSAPVFQGNITLQRRVGFRVRDWTGGVGAGPIFDGVTAIGGRLTNTVDNTLATVNEQIGILIPRLTKATANWGIQCDSALKLWQDTVTFAANPPTSIIGVTGTHTYGSGTDLPAKTFDTSPTIVVDTTLNTFADPISFFSHLTYKTATNATARNMRSLRAFVDSSTAQADTATGSTMIDFTSFFSSPTLSRVNSGTMTVTALNHFHAHAGSLGTGMTVTTRRGLLVDEYVGAATVTTQIGVDVGRLVGAGTNYGIRNNSQTRLWDDTVTFTASPVDVVAIPGTWTLGTSATVPPKVINVSASMVVNLALDAAAVPSVVHNALTYKSDTGATARDLKTMKSFRDLPTVTADASADTMVALSSFSSEPTLSIASGGTLALTDLNQLWAAAPAVGTGTTVTNRRGLLVDTYTGSGTVTNQYGVDIARLTTGVTKNVGIRNNSRTDLWDDTVTFSAIPDHVINVTGAWTLQSSATFTPRILDVSASLIIDSTLDGFAVPTIFRNAMIYRSGPNSTNRDLKQVRSFWDSITITADTSDDTMANFASFFAQPIFATADTGASGSPTLALTDLQLFYAGPVAVGANNTITTYRGYRVGDPTGSGVVTNLYGLDIANMTKGGTKNRAIRVGTGGIEISVNNSANETSTTNLPASAAVVYTKGGNLVYAYNDAGTIRYTYVPLTGTTNPAVWTKSTTGP